MDVGAACQTQARAILAMSQFRLGQLEASRASLAAAGAALERQLPKKGYLGDSWNDWIILRFLMREAKGLIDGTQPESGSTQH